MRKNFRTPATNKKKDVYQAANSAKQAPRMKAGGMTNL